MRLFLSPSCTYRPFFFKAVSLANCECCLSFLFLMMYEVEMQWLTIFTYLPDVVCYLHGLQMSLPLQLLFSSLLLSTSFVFHLRLCSLIPVSLSVPLHLHFISFSWSPPWNPPWTPTTALSAISMCGATGAAFQKNQCLSQSPWRYCTTEEPGNPQLLSLGLSTDCHLNSATNVPPSQPDLTNPQCPVAKHRENPILGHPAEA